MDRQEIGSTDRNEKTCVLDRSYITTMPDGSRWAIPVSVIAENRANYYKNEFDDNFQRSMEEDTAQLFQESSYEISDWAANNMNWSEVVKHAKKLEDGDGVDYQEGWVNGEHEIE